MSQLSEVSFFFPGEKVPAFYRLFFRNILLYPSKFLMQFLTTRVARPLQSIRSGTYQQKLVPCSSLVLVGSSGSC